MPEKSLWLRIKNSRMKYQSSIEVWWNNEEKFSYILFFQLDLQVTLERGRCPQFYADMLTTDSQSLNVVALALSILFKNENIMSPLIWKTTSLICVFFNKNLLMFLVFVISWTIIILTKTGNFSDRHIARVCGRLSKTTWCAIHCLR